MLASGPLPYLAAISALRSGLRRTHLDSRAWAPEPAGPPKPMYSMWATAERGSCRYMAQMVWTQKATSPCGGPAHVLPSHMNCPRTCSMPYCPHTCTAPVPEACRTAT